MTDRPGDALRQLGQQITKRRQEQQLSIEKVATLTGLDPGELIAIEAGELDIPLTTIFRLARTLEVTPQELLRYI